MSFLVSLPVWFVWWRTTLIPEGTEDFHMQYFSTKPLYIQNNFALSLFLILIVSAD